MTLATCCPSLLTTNAVTPSLSLTLSGAGSLQVRVMEVALQLATARACGSPVGTRKAEEGMRMCTQDTLSLLKKQGTKGRLLTELNHTECYIHIYICTFPYHYTVKLDVLNNFIGISSHI